MSYATLLIEDCTISLLKALPSGNDNSGRKYWVGHECIRFFTLDTFWNAT